MSTLLRSSKSLYLSWETPEDEDGEAMDVELLITTDPLHCKSLLVSPPSSSYVVTSLKPGTDVEFSLTAVNADGQKGPNTYGWASTISGW